MHRVKTESRRVAFAGLLLIVLFSVTACSTPAPDQAPGAAGVTVFEGARLIVGDGSAPIENAAFIVSDTRFTQVGKAGQLQVPEGAVRVDLTGRTVMPAIIDTHTHLGRTREALVEDLQRKAYYGVGVAMSLGQDSGDLPLQVREETIPDAARYRTALRGITTPEPGRSEIPYWITSEEEARTAVQELAASSPDLVKIWVDDRNGRYESSRLLSMARSSMRPTSTGSASRPTSLRSRTQRGSCVRGSTPFAHGVRDRDVDEEFLALIKERPNVVLVPNLPNRGVAMDLGWLSGTIPAEALQELQDAAMDRPAAQEAFAIQARNLARLNEAGVRIGLRNGRQRGMEPTR